MRSIIAVLLAVPAVLSHPSALAATSLSVPTFSLAFSSYGTLNDWTGSGGPASISLESTDQTSTVIALDSFVDPLHIANGGTDGRGASGPWMASVASRLNLQAADGYRITGVAFSATTYAIHTRPPVPSNAAGVDYGTHDNYAWSNVAISAPGASVQPAELYQVSGFTTPVDVGWNLSNTAGLSNFDLTMEVWGSVRTWATLYNIGGGPDGDQKAYGTTELYYVNPVLTVYTAALPVPEPGTWAMLGAGLLVVGLLRRRMR